MFHFNYPASDPSNPFIGQHVSLREHYVVQLPRGPSMLEEKLACPMEDAAHERRFLRAQQGSSASTFLDEHVSIVARTLDSMEKMFLDSDPMFQENTYSPPTPPVGTAGCVDSQTDLLYLGDCMVGADKLDSDRILESDLEDVAEPIVDIPSALEARLLLEETRRQRIRHYRQKPANLRVYKRIASKITTKPRPKPSDSARDLPRSSTGL